MRPVQPNPAASSRALHADEATPHAVSPASEQCRTASEPPWPRAIPTCRDQSAREVPAPPQSARPGTLAAGAYEALWGSDARPRWRQQRVAQTHCRRDASRDPADGSAQKQSGRTVPIRRAPYACALPRRNHLGLRPDHGTAFQHGGGTAPVRFEQQNPGPLGHAGDTGGVLRQTERNLAGRTCSTVGELGPLAPAPGDPRERPATGGTLGIACGERGRHTAPSHDGRAGQSGYCAHAPAYSRNKSAIGRPAGCAMRAGDGERNHNRAHWQSVFRRLS